MFPLQKPERPGGDRGYAAALHHRWSAIPTQRRRYHCVIMCHALDSTHLNDRRGIFGVVGDQSDQFNFESILFTTINPPPLSPPANCISAGQLLCGGLFSADSLSNWCAAVALAHALQDNLTQKEQLLRVQLATSLGKPPVSLLQQCTNILSQVGRSQWRGHGYLCRVEERLCQNRGVLMLIKGFC